MLTMSEIITRRGKVIEDPPLIRSVARWLFNNMKAAWLWLPIRIWLGYQWIDASIHKIGNPAWVSTGEALKGFWANAVSIPEGGRPPIAFDWYRNVIQWLLDMGSYTWFGKLIAYGELLVGVALILGAFTGIAAFFGGFMNWNFMMAGSASINPMMLLVSFGIILAWKVAGQVGLDRFLLPLVGVPWQWELPAGESELQPGGLAGASD
jgi:thiosulfate dehydrogenase [quinone] large subunit